MSLVYCPECGHEISQNAIACPNCGLPLSARPPVLEETTPVVPSAVVTPRVVRREGLPPWAIPVFAAGAILLVVILFLLFRGSSEDSNVNVAVNARRQAEANRDLRTTTVPPAEPQTVTVPGSQTSVPSMPSMPATETTVPGTTTAAPVTAPAAPPDKGSVAIRAKVVNARGTQQPARGVRFYLLDKDVETILSEARVEPIEGNTLSSSMGLAAVYPDKYAEFRQAAARALAAHTKYTGTTDTSGGAKLASIAPKEYYLFAITKVGNGFALWDSPVSVVPGDNIMDLSPASVTEIES